MDLRLGDVVDGRWTVVARLGEGANGVVVHARDTRGRDVALKWLLEPESPRVRRELELACTLRHLNIVPLLDAGVHAGRPWLAFELVRGHTLEDEIARGPIRVERVRLLATEILRALEAAHGIGIVHRDVKPANVMVVGDHVKLLDFGAARTPESTLTAAGETLGTPRYMAPEQVAAMPIDARTDLYALGLVMAEALSGRPIYDGALMRVLAQHASPEQVPIPETVTASSLGSVILRATQKSPAARFANAREMRKALEPRSTPRSRRGVGLLLLASTLTIASSIATLFVLGRETERPSRLEPPRSAVRAQVARSITEHEAVVNEVERALERDNWKLISRQEDTHHFLLEEPLTVTFAQFGRKVDGSADIEGIQVTFYWQEPRRELPQNEYFKVLRWRKKTLLAIQSQGHIPIEVAARALERN